jgi:1-acyl-sn-glycerol-3-phosphate acyltransferase
MRSFLTAFFRWALRIFYRRIEVTGLEKIPADAPVIFAVNHPNGLLDPLFILSFAPRRVSFLAKAPLFSMPVIGSFVRAFDSIPVYRKMDKTIGSNEETFARAREIVARGGSIAIFPEGTTHSDAKLRELKTGVARIALGASVPSLYLVPAGIYYTAKQVFRSEALVLFGDPIVVVPEGTAEEAVRALTAKVEQGLGALTLQADSRAALDLIARAEEIFSRGVERPLAEELELRRRFVEGYHYLATNDPPRLARLESAVRQFPGVSEAPSSARVSFTFLLLVPLALIGAVIHYPAYRLIGYLARRFSKGEHHMMGTIKFVAALALYPLTWAAIATMIALRFGAIPTLVALAVLPLVAWIALRIFEHIDEVIGGMRALVHESSEELTAKREAIRREIIAVGKEIG